MKKLISLLLLVLTTMMLLVAATGARAQYTEIKFPADTWLLTNFDLSSIGGTDTSFVFKIAKLPQRSWSLHSGWSGVVGVGSIKFEVTDYDDLSHWVEYDDNLTTTITGATGEDAWEDYVWSWKYFKITITKSTLSAGYLKSKININ